MEEKVIDPKTNPELANSLISQVLQDSSEETPEEVMASSENLVNLPGGYVTLTGEVLKIAEVRELTGKDEEIIARTTNLGKIFPTILSRGVVSIGNVKADESILDALLVGDRDALLLGIYKATFGPTATLGAFCLGCNDSKTVEISIDSDIKSKVLIDADDRYFTVQGKKHEYLVTLPTGQLQKELAKDPDMNYAESATIILENTVLKIDGKAVISKAQVQNLGLSERKLIIEELTERSPGPQFNDVKIDCPDCGSEVAVPINLGALFRF